MSGTPRVVWARTSAPFAAQGADATAWIVSLDDPAVRALGAPAPNAQDFADKGYAGAGSRVRFLERRVILRALVAARLSVSADQVVIAYRPGGAPFVAAPADVRLHVSLAGRDDLAAFALGAAPVGVDLEPLEPSFDPLTDVLHPTEAEALERLPAAERRRAFLRIWTGKEAYLKARGTGLICDPAAIAVSPTQGAPAVLDRGERVAGAIAWREEAMGGRAVIAGCVVLAE